MEKVVRVRVKTDVRREKIVEVKDDAFVIEVKEPAAQNAANNRVCRLLALRYGVPSKAVQIKTGHTSPSKTISIRV